LSSDPYTNTSSQHATEVEPGAFSYGSTMVVAFQAGRFVDGGRSNNGWAASVDGGHSWKSGFLPGITQFAGGSYTRASDPAVAYDPAHNSWIIASLAISGNGPTLNTHAIVVNLSTDGGFTWSKPYTVVNGGSTYYDKEWITCDTTASSSFYGHCYIEWDDDNRGGLILMSTSADGGRTWTRAQTTADAARGTGGQPLVQPDGTVVVPISGYNDSQMLSFVSRDGGKSWSHSTLVAHIHGGVLPSAQIDGLGKIYLVWIDCRFEKNCQAQGGEGDAVTGRSAAQGDDVVMSTTTDGLHWSEAQLIPIDAAGSGINHINPGLGVDRNTFGGIAHLALVYYTHPAKCPSDCPYTLGYVSSSDGGSHWTRPAQLARSMNLSWLPQGHNKVGDYISLAFANGLAFPFFSLADAPDAGGHLNEAIYTISGGLDV
jgi:BNR repeat-like domain